MEPIEKFAFHVDRGDSDITYVVKRDEADWPTLLREFVLFLDSAGFVLSDDIYGFAEDVAEYAKGEVGVLGSKRKEINTQEADSFTGLPPGWIPHTPGDPQPVPDHWNVQVKLEDETWDEVLNETEEDAMPATDWDWRCLSNAEGRIVAYKVISKGDE